MVNNLNDIKWVEPWGQKYGIVNIIPINCKITIKTTDSNRVRYLYIDPTEKDAQLYTYGLINPQFWIDRSSSYESDANGANCIDFGFKVDDVDNTAETESESAGLVDTLTDILSENVVHSQYYKKDKLLIDEIMEWREFDMEHPLLLSYYDEIVAKQYAIEFKSTSRAANNYDLYFSCIACKYRIKPDDLVIPQPF